MDTKSETGEPNGSNVPSFDLLDEPDRIEALLDSQRQRLVDALAEEPDSAVGLARRLGDTRQRLNYHLGKLEEAGLVELVEERPRRGVKERIYRPAAERFVLDPAALTSLEPGRDRMSVTYLVALAARAVGELGGLSRMARQSGAHLPTAGLDAEVRLARPEDYDAFIEDLVEAVSAVIARHHTDSEGGRSFRVLAGAWPKPSLPEDHDPDEEESAP